jgi:hypothetical protein
MMTFNTDRLMREAAQPSLIKEVESVWNLEQKAREWLGAATQSGRSNMNHYLECGRVLIRLKAQCKSEGKSFEESLDRLNVKSQRASEMMRAAELPKDVLTRCDSWRDVLKALNLDESPTVGDKPTRKKAAKVREPGDDGDEPTDVILKWVDSVEVNAGKKIVLIGKIKQVDYTEAKQATAMVSQALNGVRELASRAYRPVPPAQKKVCRKCGAAVLLVTSTKGSRFYVEGPGRGRFKLEGGLAVHVPPEQREGKEFELHRLRCVPSKGGQN